MPKFLSAPGYFYYKVSKEQQVIIFTAVKCSLFLMLLYFFVSQSSVAGEILSPTPIVPSFPHFLLFCQNFPNSLLFSSSLCKACFPHTELNSGWELQRFHLLTPGEVRSSRNIFLITPPLYHYSFSVHVSIFQED